MAFRVLFAAMARCARTGHATFAPGELTKILGSVDLLTGEVRPTRADTVSRAIRSAKRLDFVAEESTVRCLVLRRHVFQKGRGKASSCLVHAA